MKRTIAIACLLLASFVASADAGGRDVFVSAKRWQTRIREKNVELDDLKRLAEGLKLRDKLMPGDVEEIGRKVAAVETAIERTNEAWQDWIDEYGIEASVRSEFENVKTALGALEDLLESAKKQNRGPEG